MNIKEDIYAKVLIILIISSVSNIFLINMNLKIWSYILIVLTLVLIFAILYRAKSEIERELSDTNDISRFSEYFMKDNLFKQLYPLVFIKDDGTMVWYNRRFKEIFDLEKAKGDNIASVVRGIYLENIIMPNKTYCQKLSVNKNTYEIYSKKIIKAYNGKDINMVFFNDISYIEEGTKESIIIIEVDNLAEVIKSVDSIKSSLLTAEIDSLINEYAKNINAMIIRYENNKYILSVLDSNIEVEMSRKFDILDKVRQISIGNKLEPTLSIGIGRAGVNPRENQKNATMALELALGRGGDQVVVKTKDKLSFFGGTTKELEQRTRVRARVIAHSLRDLVYESSKVYIVGHKNPDMDCFGAAIGLYEVIKQLGKNCRIIKNDDTKAVSAYLSKIIDEGYDKNNIFIDDDTARNEIDDDTLVIVVDVHSKNYVGNLDIIERAKKVVIIDHHRRSPDALEGALLTYIEVYASSTSELITEMIQYIIDKPKISRIVAEGLLAGICVDTKNFNFKTGVRTFEAASFLRRLGADTTDVKKMFSNDLKSYIEKSDTIRSAKVKNNIAIAVCPSSVNDTVIAAQAADDLLNITQIEASFVLLKMGEDVIISARSFGNINVQVILETLGGGGHMTIAGANLKHTTIEEAVEDVKDAINKYLQEGDK